MIHRAIAGSLERFMSVIIEHFAGVFPLWLAPTQIIVVPVGNAFNEYATDIYDKLTAAGMRVELDAGTDGLNKKVRNAEQRRANYIVVVGEKEQTENTVSVRNYITKEQTNEVFVKFLSRIEEEIAR